MVGKGSNFILSLPLNRANKGNELSEMPPENQENLELEDDINDNM